MTKEKNEIKSTKKIFAILEELAKNDGRMKLKDIAETLGFPTSTTHRLLSSLREVGYVNQDEVTGEYTLGLRILYLANSVLSRLDLRKIAFPYLEKMSNETGETANLVVQEHDEALYIEKVESKALVRVFSLIGKRAPLHATGVGKIMLADMAWPDVMSILKRKGMEKLSPHTIDDPDVLMEELNKIRKQGYALDEEECELDAWCVAAPVRDYTGKVVASISVSLPISRLTVEKKVKFIELVKEYGNCLSHKLGYLIEEHNI